MHGCDALEGGVQKDTMVYKIDIISFQQSFDNVLFWDLAIPLRVNNNKQNCFKPEMYYIVIDSFVDRDTLLLVPNPGKATNGGNESYISRIINAQRDEFENSAQHKQLRYSSDYGLFEEYAYATVKDYEAIYYIGDMKDPEMLNAIKCKDELQVKDFIYKSVQESLIDNQKYLVVYATVGFAECSVELYKRNAKNLRVSYDKLAVTQCSSSQFKGILREYFMQLDKFDKLLKYETNCVELSKAKSNLSKVAAAATKIAIDCGQSSRVVSDDSPLVAPRGGSSIYRIDLDEEYATADRDREKLRQYETLSGIITDPSTKIIFQNIKNLIATYRILISKSPTTYVDKIEYDKFVASKNTYSFGIRREFEKLDALVKESCSSEYLKHLERGRGYVENARKLSDDKKNRSTRINYLYNAIRHYINAEASCPDKVDIDALKRQIEIEFPEEYIHAVKQ